MTCNVRLVYYIRKFVSIDPAIELETTLSDEVINDLDQKYDYRNNLKLPNNLVNYLIS